MRGALQTDWLMASTRPGSSPRMRGALCANLALGIRVGIIPADAGSTLASRMANYFAEDHPRGCGEHPWGGAGNDEPEGSSPRMRGAQAIIPMIGLPSRIIPADAGSTGKLQRPDHVGQDHPRGCGEHRSGCQRKQGRRGSSPRMRGALFYVVVKN